MRCPECLGPLGDVSEGGGQDDAGATTEWGCKNPRCLSSIHHRYSKCPQCKARPQSIADAGGGQLTITCKQGHPYTVPMPR